jgi:hydroxyacylglutathione hydrolase
MQVHILPVLKDNYIFLLHDRLTNQAIAIDPAQAAPVIAKLQELQADLIAILNTHHHHDHIGGNQELSARFPNLVIYGGELDRGRIPHQQVFVKDGDRLDFSHKFGNNIAEVLFIPGHTRSHVAYYFDRTADLFCGDTLFGGACGRLFEGTPRQMLNSLTRLAQLPATTKVWCAHEYTLSNLQFAITIDNQNLALQARLEAATSARANHQSTIPSNIGLEIATNPFLRCDRPEILAKLGFTTSINPEVVFTKLRSMKDIA